MPRGRMAMESIEEILRLHHECKRSQREIARSCGLSAGAINGLLQRAARAGLGWPLPEGLEPGQLHERLYGTPAGGGARLRGDAQGAEPAAAPDLAAAVGGVPGGTAGRVRVQPVLRAVPAVEGAPGPGDAAGAQGRGEAVRGLRRADGAGAGSGQRRRCSWRCWGRVRTATPKSAGGRAWRAGSRRTCARSSISEAAPSCSCPIMFPGT